MPMANEFSTHQKGQLIQDGIIKQDILPNYSFNLLSREQPLSSILHRENTLRVSKKCLPITWTDECVHNDFNPKAFLNLHRFHSNLSDSLEYLLSETELKRFTVEPLLLKKPKTGRPLNFVAKF